MDISHVIWKMYAVVNVYVVCGIIWLIFPFIHDLHKTTKNLPIQAANMLRRFKHLINFN